MAEEDPWFGGRRDGPACITGGLRRLYLHIDSEGFSTLISIDVLSSGWTGPSGIGLLFAIAEGINQDGSESCKEVETP